MASNNQLHQSTLDNTEKPEAEERIHTSLHHSLLGPSLQKAGQDSVDQKKVAEVIYKASVGSKFFKHEEKRDEQLSKKIEAILARKKYLESIDLSSELRRIDERIAHLDATRDVSQYIVHVDCDAFFASVEELDRPELKNVPMAVGKGVLTTCNYKAREFGCRSGMAGHIAKKLCPQLVFLPINFEKYNRKAEEIRQIIAKYDPRFEAASVDEAYLNVTDYCKEHNLDPDTAVSTLRAEVLERTKISVSAGIGPNTRIAKIASNKNKPNGQFLVPNDRETVMDFMADLSVRKINGIGRVFERELDSVGIKTCKDIYPLRGILTNLFGEKSTEFLIHCYLGLGRTEVHPVEEYERKSVGTERTFPDLTGAEKLRKKMRNTAEDLEKELEEKCLALRTLVLKIKLHTYGVHSRQRALHRPIHSAEDIYQYALPLLTALENDFKDKGGLKIRLMGLRGTNLVDRNKKTQAFWDKWGGKAETAQCSGLKRKIVDDDGWEIWPEEELMEMGPDSIKAESQMTEEPNDEEENLHSSKQGNLDQGLDPEHSLGQQAELEIWQCPICSRSVPADDRQFNEHVDFCLSKQAIKDIVRETSSPEDVSAPPSKRPKTMEKKKSTGKNNTITFIKSNLH
ncbi:hypothetical protein BDZ91DRAFT_692591 [Kalaharituber pfeilii]|nr:hypothetical protein BDZ91DRAFT_692591 [Kalaharituber pfeilii]